MPIRYLISRPYVLHGWKKLPYALQNYVSGKTDFFRQDDFFLLQCCDGQTVIDREKLTEEEKAKVWNEIQRKRSQENLEAVDDDELEAVNGGVCIWNGVYASDGKEVGCLAWDYIDWAEAQYNICPESKDGHDWEEGRRFNVADLRYQEIRCKKCHYKTKVLLNAGVG